MRTPIERRLRAASIEARRRAQVQAIAATVDAAKAAIAARKALEELVTDLGIEHSERPNG